MTPRKSDRWLHGGDWSSDPPIDATLRARRCAAFLGSDAASGVLLCFAAAAAVLWASSTWSTSYVALWQAELSVPLSGPELTKSLQEWINDALMVLFFLVVGLEVKRELVIGHLRDPRAAMVPIAAALGGMAVPALLPMPESA